MARVSGDEVLVIVRAMCDPSIGRVRRDSVGYMHRLSASAGVVSLCRS